MRRFVLVGLEMLICPASILAAGGDCHSDSFVEQVYEGTIHPSRSSSLNPCTTVGRLSCSDSAREVADGIRSPACRTPLSIADRT